MSETVPKKKVTKARSDLTYAYVVCAIDKGDFSQTDLFSIFCHSILLMDADNRRAVLGAVSGLVKGDEQDRGSAKVRRLKQAVENRAGLRLVVNRQKGA